MRKWVVGAVLVVTAALGFVVLDDDECTAQGHLGEVELAQC
jgi:hypothetical protein